MKLLPIHDEKLDEAFPIWFPFLQQVAKHSREPINDLLARVASHELQPVLIWDEVEKRTVALVLVRYCRQDQDLVGEVFWVVGKGRKRWQGLLGELEDYLHNHIGCTITRSVCRPGWEPMLTERGYRITRYIMEKRLKESDHGRQQRTDSGADDQHHPDAEQGTVGGSGALSQPSSGQRADAL